MSVIEENFYEYVGKLLFNSDWIYDEILLGVVMGLVWILFGMLLFFFVFGLMICFYYFVWKVDFGKYWSLLFFLKKNRVV